MFGRGWSLPYSWTEVHVEVSPHNYDEKWTEKMPQRCQAIMANNGDKTPY